MAYNIQSETLPNSSEEGSSNLCLTEATVSCDFQQKRRQRADLRTNMRKYQIQNYPPVVSITYQGHFHCTIIRSHTFAHIIYHVHYNVHWIQDYYSRFVQHRSSFHERCRRVL